MKYFSLAVITAFALSSCGPKIYKSQAFENSKTTVKKLAILPFAVTIDLKRLPKTVTAETIRDAEEKTGYDIQNNIYTYFLKRQKTYSVEFQDIDQTNALLKKNGFTYRDLLLKEKGEICKLLGVDAIVSGKVVTSKPMSEGAALALTLIGSTMGSTNKSNATITIHDISSALLWKYDHSQKGSIGSSSEKLTSNLMKKSSKKFPYNI